MLSLHNLLNQKIQKKKTEKPSKNDGVARDENNEIITKDKGSISADKRKLENIKMIVETYGLT